LGRNSNEQDIKRAFKLASVCEHPNAVWLTKLVAGRDVASREEARQVFLGCERALCFAGFLARSLDQIRRAADPGDAFAQARMAEGTSGKERFQWAQKSVAQGERDGFLQLEACYRHGSGCEKGAEKQKRTFLVAAELGHVSAMVCLSNLLENNDPQRFAWLGRAAANRYPYPFLDEMSDQILSFGSGTGNANVVFVIGRALKGQVDNEKRTIFDKGYKVDCIGPANQALHFYEFNCNRIEKQSTAGRLLD
jgi:TPR repeat protein